MPEIVAISDIHVGHPAAIWPKSFTTTQGNIIMPNKAQQVMLDYWKDFFSQPAVKGAEYVLNLDESIEGYNRKEHGKDIMISVLGEQERAFVELLKPHINGKKYVCVDGSGYHGSEDTSVAERICREFVPYGITNL